MKAASTVEASTSVKATSAVEAASTVERMETAAMETAHRSVSDETARAAHKRPESGPADKGPKAGASIEAVEPRTGTDEDAAREPLRAVVAIRRARVRRVWIVAIGADGRPNIGRRADANADCNSLSLRVRRGNQENAKYSQKSQVSHCSTPSEIGKIDLRSFLQNRGSRNFRDTRPRTMHGQCQTFVAVHESAKSAIFRRIRGTVVRGRLPGACGRLVVFEQAWCSSASASGGATLPENEIYDLRVGTGDAWGGISSRHGRLASTLRAEPWPSRVY